MAPRQEESPPNNKNGADFPDDLSNSSSGNDLISSHPSDSSAREGAGSTDGSSSKGHSSGNSTGNSSYELFGFTRHHFQAISCSRWIFLATLLLAAAGLSTAVYFILEDEQVDSFEAQFENLAREVNEVANEHVQSVFNLMDGVTKTVTSFIEVQAADPSFNYPPGFMTLPHMEQHFGSARNASGASVLAYIPLIQPNDLATWANYSFENQGWIGKYNVFHNDDSLVEPILEDIWEYPSEAALDVDECEPEEEPEAGMRTALTPEDGPFSPVWTFSPAPKPSDTTIVNQDLFGRAEFRTAAIIINATRKPLFLDVCNLGSWFNMEKEREYGSAVVAYPVFAEFTDTAKIVGHLIEIMPWASFFENILPEATEPLLVVVQSSCGQGSTYEIRGREVELLSRGKDLHDEKYNSMVVSSIFASSDDALVTGLDGVCVFSLSVYPTPEFEAAFDSQKPLHYSLVVLAVFFVTAVLFFLFDVLMTRQRNQVMETAKKQNAIVSSLFPKSIQAKMMEQVDSENRKLSKMGKAGLKNFLFDTQAYGGDASDSVKEEGVSKGFGPSGKTKPIADLFPETTIMFGDIAGFTAWASAREPSQVFILLETIYHEFDMIAKRRRVFKVEVVGDCYVAVCGLPDPRADHAVVICKFAMECVKEMNRLTHELEVDLGPDTAELALRVGLHSGPVVAGVLRGEKSRFQLFGDTMNTASRMESTGTPNMVQISQETADLLTEGNKKHWFEARQEKIQVKGKGQLTTYFLKIMTSKSENNTAKSVASGYTSEDNSTVNSSLHSFPDDSQVVEKRNRITNWTVETLSSLLKEVVVRRQAERTKSDSANHLSRIESSVGVHRDDGSTVINEVHEIIELPRFDVGAAHREAEIDASTISLPAEVLEELREFVRTIAGMYHDNPFHNFPHANHVTMSVVKLLSRIQAPDVEEVGVQTLHDHTYGITSDPLTRFSVVLAALIHDVDHMGVPNAQLIKEKDPVADLYNNKSVAEQNSIDLAWDLLMEPQFMNLRRQIYTTKTEFQRFRQLLVNSVMATDIMDKDLKDLRNKRWADAFSDECDKAISNSRRQDVNRKATIVIEHLIQASDVAHTMQHWHIYRKWNERLFQEMHKAWQEGRMDTHPADNWYKGEIGFFDFYIIPLAKKLKECGVFGVSSDEYLSYALQNRKEWEVRGEALVQEMVGSLEHKTVAKSISAASQQAVDHEGREIVAGIAAARRTASMSHQNSTAEETLTDDEATDEFEMDLKK